jgi:hypothetical protein
MSAGGWVPDILNFILSGTSRAEAFPPRSATTELEDGLTVDRTGLLRFDEPEVFQA